MEKTWRVRIGEPFRFGNDTLQYVVAEGKIICLRNDIPEVTLIKPDARNAVRDGNFTEDGLILYQNTSFSFNTCHNSGGGAVENIVLKILHLPFRLAGKKADWLAVNDHFLLPRNARLRPVHATLFFGILLFRFLIDDTDFQSQG